MKKKVCVFIILLRHIFYFINVLVVYASCSLSSQHSVITHYPSDPLDA